MEHVSQIGDFTVERELGSGGMATVYLGRHPSGDRSALKVLHLSAPIQVERAKREGEVQSQLIHANVVHVSGVIDWDGPPCLVMEYVDGPSLKQFLLDYRPTAAEALEIFKGVLSGVAAAHSAGLVHRDLKPDNVLLARFESGICAKVCDFGLVKLPADDDGRALTREGAMLGTAQYMAPEQFTDARSVDHRADIWSLGCLLYELVSGRPAFDGPSFIDIWRNVRNVDYPPLREVVPDAAPGVLAAVDAALRHDPDARPPSCAALSRILFQDAENPATDATTSMVSLHALDAVDALAEKRRAPVRVVRSGGGVLIGLVLGTALVLPLALLLVWLLRTFLRS